MINTAPVPSHFLDEQLRFGREPTRTGSAGVGLAALAGKILYRAGAAKLRRQFGIRQREVVTSSGVRIAFDELAPEQKEKEKGGAPRTLICFPGFASSKDFFLRFAGQLDQTGMRVIVPDLPGFGISAKPDGVRYTLAQYGIWFDEFIAALDLDQGEELSLLGNSLGGAVALELVLGRGLPVKQLCLVASGGVFEASIPSVYQEIELGQNPFRVQTPTDYERFRKRLFGKALPTPAIVKAFLSREFIGQQRRVAQILHDLSTAPDGSVDFEGCAFNDRLSEIPCRTLVAWGDEDRLLPVALGRLIAEAVPHAELNILEGVGHCPQLEAAEELAECVGKFLGSDA